MDDLTEYLNDKNRIAELERMLVNQESNTRYWREKFKKNRNAELERMLVNQKSKTRYWREKFEKIKPKAKLLAKKKKGDAKLLIEQRKTNNLTLAEISRITGVTIHIAKKLSRNYLAKLNFG